jgi:hypothetical protein
MALYQAVYRNVSSTKWKEFEVWGPLAPQSSGNNCDCKIFTFAKELSLFLG